MSSKNSIQVEINKDLRKRINLQNFIKKGVVDKIKNTFGVKCRKCGSEDVYVISKQTRSADEATTKIYECLKCGNKWTVY